MTNPQTLWVTCPTCGAEGQAFNLIVREWNGTNYLFRCGHAHHLDPLRGGARTELRTPSADPPTPDPALVKLYGADGPRL